MLNPLDFKGAKIAVLYQDNLIAYQRDQKPEIPFPGMWDLPGGGREENETPSECAIRETCEEFGIRIPPETIVWEKRYTGSAPESLASYFLVAHLPAGFGTITFGEEGERWKIMSIKEFLEHPEVVGDLKIRLQDYLRQNHSASGSCLPRHDAT